MYILAGQQRTLIVGILVVLLALGTVLLLSVYKTFLGVRLPVLPSADEIQVGGYLDTTNLAPGAHTLEFNGRTTQGDVVRTSVIFMVEESGSPYSPYGGTDPYDNDPYSPYGS